MDIPVNAKVQCSDRPGGRSTYIVINPSTQQVTHLVVKESKIPHVERLVAIEQVEEATPTSIRLGCTRDELAKMDHFIDYEYNRVTEPSNEYLSIVPPIVPHMTPVEKEEIVLEHEHIPAGELAVSRGAHVEATDGYVGRVDEFLVQQENSHITHLVMREGHLWGQKEVAIPVSGIDRMSEDIVYLKLDKQEVNELPTVPLKRWVKDATSIH